MVTKATRMQSRRTNTAGKVPTAAELLEGELFFNLPDRTIYTKDASGVVYKVALSPAETASKFVGFDADKNVSIPGYTTSYKGMATLGETYGGGQTAVGEVTSINGLQFGVPNVIAEPTNLSTHGSIDAVGHVTFMQGNQNVLIVPASGTTYAAGYVQNAAIIAGANCKPGQIIQTGHSPAWRGVVTTVDDVNHRANVAAWYRVDGSGSTGTPANGVGCVINGATKLFARNTILWAGVGNSPDLDGHGDELDVVFWKSGLGVWYGWDAVCYGAYQPARSIAHTARWGGGVARWDGGFYAEDTLSLGAYSAYWRSNLDFSKPLVKSKVGADELFTINAAGKVSAVRETYFVTSVSMTVDALNTSVIICTNPSGSIAITLPSAAQTGFNDGRSVRVVTLGAGGATVVKPGGAVLATLTTGRFQKVLAANNDWQPDGSGPV